MAALAGKLRLPPSEYLKRFYYDAVIYRTSALQAAIGLAGSGRLMFGTDNPFFPPPEGPRSDAEWPSTIKNYAIMTGLDASVREGILRDNASRLLSIPLP
jgi:aminocarboxymuconate-semialdehyde decarboxylase